MNRADGEPCPGIAERLATLLERIDRACRRAGRDPRAVTLIGASKLQPTASLHAAYRAGLRDFGENRVQEAERKRPLLPPDVRWHLLGPLQSNKVAKAVVLFDVLHALDRDLVAQAVSDQAQRHGRVLPVLVEVNLGGEANKHGFPPAAVPGAWERLVGLPGVLPEGLMAIPPVAPSAEAMRPWFRSMRTLAQTLVRPDGAGLALSMGMSDDFEVAIEEGATLVRIGTALFGARRPA